jgi:hypothetical protein
MIPEEAHVKRRVFGVNPKFLRIINQRTSIASIDLVINPFGFVS